MYFIMDVHVYVQCTYCIFMRPKLERIETGNGPFVHGQKKCIQWRHHFLRRAADLFVTLAKPPTEEPVFDACNVEPAINSIQEPRILTSKRKSIVFSYVA